MWTMDNTEGFSQDQIDLINEAIKRISAEHPGIDGSSLDDAANNAWGDQDDVQSLVTSMKQHLGLC